jgi:hypothetical protein
MVLSSRLFVSKLAWLLSEEAALNLDMKILLRVSLKYRLRRRHLSTIMHEPVSAYMFQ